jgi:L-ascorbate metabolism protein UlaG (beta-lactamase superfamily)
VRAAPERPDPAKWSDRGIYAAWLGHSTVLLKIDGVTILTDPVLSTRIGLNFASLTIGIKRLVAPALAAPELPEIDVVLLSHAHFDHFDIPTLRALESRGTTVVTAARTADLLRVNRYAHVRELGWDERASIGALDIRAFRVNHWGARMRNDSYRGFNGYTIDTGHYRVLFGGDTALTDGFRKLRSSRPFDLAIMPVGAYNPWIHYHCTPEQSWQLAEEAGSEFFLPVHHQTFTLSREPYLEPIERLAEAAGRHQGRVALQRIGQEFHCS